MTGPAAQIVIADTSVLVNFLCIHRMDLLGALSVQVEITAHVRDEVTEDYPEQQAGLLAALDAGMIAVCGEVSPSELAMFGSLMGSGRLGAGECAAIARAIDRHHSLAIDDRKAIAEAMRASANLAILRTSDMIVLMLKEQLLTVVEADAIKSAWETEHRFRLPFASFAELL